ncbi:MAG TPA: protein kinase [Vicinamibacterales bacterium]|nr:protein kinase [Vicinamibacterales bacterium]
MQALTSGSRLGLYTIQALIGRGGMGEVYKAADTRLHRDVALKVLPHEFAADADRVARFEREAHVLASLNHPNIAQIHGFEQCDGTHALVMEFVDGVTLADRIAQGPLSLDDSLSIARQIALALEAAHDAGVVHRDLKPANIKLRPDDTVKVLDFGLAKAIDRLTPTTELANSPTITAPMTHAGVVLGTAAYMSPEQARGKAVDKRTDIWAFGCVLYEMLTGRPAFSGETVSDVIASVLRAEVDWDALPSSIPLVVRRLVRRCLNKDPRERWADMRDARIEIVEALDSTSVVTASTASSRSRTTSWLIAAALIALTLITGFGAALATGAIELSGRDENAAVVRFSFQTPPNIGALDMPKVSPDGRHIAFFGTRQGAVPSIWVHTFSTGSARAIAGTDDPIVLAGLFWSPDSRSIGFFADGKLKRVDINGGGPVILAEAADGRGGSWNQYGEIIFVPSGPSGLLRISAGGGATTPLMTAPAESITRFPNFLSTGRAFLFLEGSAVRNLLMLGKMDGTAPRQLREVTAFGGVTTDDTVLFTDSGGTFAQRLDVQRGEFAGERLALQPANISFSGGASISAAAQVLVYRSPESRLVKLAWVDRRGAVSLLQLPPADYGDPTLSPDGQRVALTLREQSGMQIWVYDTARGTLGKRTFEGPTQFPIWTPDGKFLVFSQGAGMRGPLIKMGADGIGKPEVLVSPDAYSGLKIATSWSADGQRLAFQHNQDVLVREADGTIRPALNGAAYEREARFAPDGRWLLYRSNETGRDEVYVQSYPPGNGKWQISTDGGTQGMWAPNGKELFYKNGNRLMVVPIELGSGFNPGGPKMLFQIPLPESSPGDASRYGVSPDGQRFLVTTTDNEAPPAPTFNVVLNWQREFEKARNSP